MKISLIITSILVVLFASLFAYNNSELTEKTSEIESLKSEIDKQKEKIDDLENEISSLEKENKQLKRNLSDCEDEQEMRLGQPSSDNGFGWEFIPPSEREY